MTQRFAHARLPFSGRDPDEHHRAATPLELLYDLTLVVAFGVAADELAHLLAEGHAWAAIGGFVLAVFAISWAWVNYTWLASAFDTDDWVVRLAVMVQMIGVVVLALGIEPAMASVDEGGPFDGGVLVGGYVVMRIPLLFLWWRVHREAPECRPAATRYMTTLALAQAGWIVFALLDLSLPVAFACFLALGVVELSGPVMAERSSPTPWHPHHIAERYGLLVIITLGEGIIGTVAALGAVVHGEQGWSVAAALLALSGVGLTFAAWWIYFAVPWAQSLEGSRGFVGLFGYGHLVVFGALAAVGAGLHVAAYALEDKAEIGDVAVVATVGVPLGIFLLALYTIWSFHLGTFDRFHAVLLAATAVVLAAALLLTAAGLSTEVALLVLLLAPIISIAGYETVGHRHAADAVGGPSV